MENRVDGIAVEAGRNLPETLASRARRGRDRQTLIGSFAIIGTVLQQPRQFFKEVRQGTHLIHKIRSLLVCSAIFLSAYGATLGSGHPLLSLNMAAGMPLLFLSSLVTCLPAMYLLDVLTGSRRSLAQIAAVLLSALTAASTVFFSFAPIMVVFGLTGTLGQFFWLNLGILAIAVLVGLMYMVQGIIQTAIVDPDHNLSQANRRLHFVWMLLFLLVSAQIAWGLLSFYQRTGGFLGLLIQFLAR